MFAILAVILAASPVTTQAPTPDVAPPAATAVASPLPGMPVNVTVTRTPEGDVLTWQPPTSTGATKLTGYVVIHGETATLLDGATTQFVVTSDVPYSVAAMNGVGCSLAAKAAVIAAAPQVRVEQPVRLAGK